LPHRTFGQSSGTIRCGTVRFIGAAVGVFIPGFGIAVNHGPGGFVLGAGVGAGIGAGIDALINDTVYSAAQSSRTVNVRPIVERERRALFIAIGF